MWRPGRSRSARPERQSAPGYRRELLAVALGLVTVICLVSAFTFARDMRFLMPGPLVSAHGTIEKCSACHTTSGDGKLSWLHSLVAGDPVADSNACLTCHKMPATAFNAHGASRDVLEQSTKRLLKVAAQTRAPQWARAQNAAFSTHDMVARGLYCATCHREHQGANFNLRKISNEQCQSCHVVKFDSFDRRHPEFTNYPFKRRTPIIYDHAGHGGKYFPDVAKKVPTRRIPATCSSCHNSNDDRRLMVVAPFEQTCSGCHLGQITGKDRVSGPKGIAFLTVPGLDLQTLKQKNASIGEWPAASEAELTPFMKVMISRNERGRAVINAVERLNLQDLSNASDDQIQAVTDLVWEIKRLFYALIWGKASDVLGNLNIDCEAKLSENLVADLTASIPRDVVISAHQQWLPNLGTEMANRPETSDPGEQSCWIGTVGGWITTMSGTGLAGDSETAGIAKSTRAAEAETDSKDASGAANVRVDSQGRLIKEREEETAAVQPAAAQPPASRPTAAQPEGTSGKSEAASARADAGNKAPPAAERPQARAADQTDDLLNLTEEELRENARPPGTAVKGYTAYAGADGIKETVSVNEQSRTVNTDIRNAERIAQAEGAAQRPAPAGAGSKAADQTDDLLNPTEDELRGIAAPTREPVRAPQPDGAVRPPASAASSDSTSARGAENTAPPEAGRQPAANAGPGSAVPGPANASPRAPANAPAAPSAAGAPVSPPQPRAAPVISIESDVDPESWAEYGGWYRQDYAIFYRPVGHKDKFIFSWLFLTGPQASKADRSPASGVFNSLASKDAAGACTKCHSVDDALGRGRLVNFSPPKIETRRGRFTSFIHEPHFGILENRGCLTCHNLEKGRPVVQGYEQGDPRKFTSNFSAVKKELCQTCHTNSMARQDCLLCHKYHVNGTTTPTMSTRIPSE